MRGINTLFQANPLFLAQRKVICAMNFGVSNATAAFGPGAAKTAFNFVFTFDYEKEAVRQITHGTKTVLAALDQKHKGKFDLEPSPYQDMLWLKVCSEKDGAIHTGSGSEVPLKGFWCPYVSIGNQGQGQLQNVPYVDVPRVLPHRGYVFTDAMNGCSIVITDIGHGMIRFYHDSTHNMAMFANQNVLYSLGYDAASNTQGYYAHQGPPTVLRTSCNFMHYSNQHWYLVCQPQIDVIGGGGLRYDFNPQIAPFEVQIT